MENVTPREHASEEELIAYYYGCEEPTANVAVHLAACGECRASLEGLKRDLHVASELVVPEREAAYEANLWARLAALEPLLAGQKGTGQKGSGLASWRNWFAARHFAPMGALAGLLAVAFLAGRYSNDVTKPQPQHALERGSGKAGMERILAAALDAHLADSERILLDVVNTDAGSEDWTSQRDRAGELVDANRLYRMTAARQGQAALAAVLEDLARVLLELSHSPEEGAAARMTPLRERITDQELVFKLRILQLRLRDQPHRPQGDRKG
jgi:hypothetical protein